MDADYLQKLCEGAVLHLKAQARVWQARRGDVVRKLIVVSHALGEGKRRIIIIVLANRDWI